MRTLLVVCIVKSFKSEQSEISCKVTSLMEEDIKSPLDLATDILQNLKARFSST